MDVNRIICCDCINGMKELDAECIDLSVTSPPFDDLRTYDGYQFDHKSILAGVYRVLKPGGVLVWVVADATHNFSETGTSFRQALHAIEVGYKLWDTMIYMRNAITNPSKVRYYNCFQYMFILSKGKPRAINLLKDRKNKTAGKKASYRKQRESDGKLHLHECFKAGVGRPEYSVRWNVWRYNVGSLIMAEDREWADHPAIFPLKLAEDHIKSWSNEGDLVFDPMCGSGQTLIGAKKLKRNYLGMDISDKYCEMSEKRLELY